MRLAVCHHRHRHCRMSRYDRLGTAHGRLVQVARKSLSLVVLILIPQRKCLALGLSICLLPTVAA
jgi:hypothetical protein